jgi:hypothetical protein
MSFRFDTPLIASSFHFGNRGLGVLGSAVPSVGDNGPSYLYNDLNLPDDANKEYSGFVETPPGIGTFFAYEDGSFSYDGPTSFFTYRLREDGVDLGTQTVTLNMSQDCTGIMAWTESSDIMSMSAAITIPLNGSINWAEADDVVLVVAELTGVNVGVVSWTEADDVTSLLSFLQVTTNTSYTEEPDSHNISASILGVNTGMVSWLEADDGLNIQVTLHQPASAGVYWSEVNDIMHILGSVVQPAYGSINWIEANDSYYILTTLPGSVSAIPANLKVRFKNPKYKITFKRE